MSDCVKPDAEDGSRLRLSFVAACLPHPKKAKTGGEDAYFACHDTGTFGVADGVGGYTETGVDPGTFARHLLSFAHQRILEGSGGDEGSSAGSGSGFSSKEEAPDSLQDAFQAAVRGLHEENCPGGSTALLGQLSGSMLTVLNLGDSGVIVLRPALRHMPGSNRPLLFPRVIFRSSDQTHYFNFPYQLGSSNAPLEAPDLVRLKVRTADIIVAATDGVFDNLFDHQVQAIVARHLGEAWRSGEDVRPRLKELADGIAHQAHKIGQQEEKDIMTPFALSAMSEGLSFSGGKLDDTTLVIGLVCKEDSASEFDKIPLIHNFY